MIASFVGVGLTHAVKELVRPAMVDSAPVGEIDMTSGPPSATGCVGDAEAPNAHPVDIAL